MKTVLHHNKVYHINDWTYEALVNYRNKLNALPKEQRKNSIEKQCYDACKAETFGSTDFTKIDLAI